MDHYSTPASEMFTYQFILQYKLNDDNYIRIQTSKANRGPFIADLFANIRSSGIHFEGNPNLDLTKTFSHEIGFKTKISKKLQGDIEAFYSHTYDFAGLQFDGYNSTFTEAQMKYKNFLLHARQLGATFNLSYALNKSSKITAFGTIQNTQLTDYEKSTDPSEVLAPFDTLDVDHKNTPSFYGGAFLETKVLRKFLLFANIYSYSSQEYWYYISETSISAKVRVDAKIAYPIWKNNTVFLNGRNIFNSDAKEFGYADNIGSLYLIGIDLNFLNIT